MLRASEFLNSNAGMRDCRPFSGSAFGSFVGHSGTAAFADRTNISAFHSGIAQKPGWTSFFSHSSLNSITRQAREEICYDRLKLLNLLMHRRTTKQVHLADKS